jgi:hypothetical protein
MRQHNELDGYSGPDQPETNHYLRSRYGDGFMGFPTYRLVYSSYVTSLSAGEWCDWDTNLPVELRGRLVAGETGKELVPETREERRVTEMRRTEEYAEYHHTPGWICERWMAPAYWGAPSEWEDRVVAGTRLPQLGPYPHQGKYMLIGGPYSEAPTGPFLDRLIQQWELMRDEVLAYSAASYVRKRHYEAEERDRLRTENWNREASLANMTAMQPLFSTFLEAGRARQLAAEHAGIRSNYGN